jgi:hypothetical protein
MSANEYETLIVRELTDLRAAESALGRSYRRFQIAKKPRMSTRVRFATRLADLQQKISRVDQLLRERAQVAF